MTKNSRRIHEKFSPGSVWRTIDRRARRALSVRCAISNPEYNPTISNNRSSVMDPENPPSIVLPIAIMIAILAACGILSLVMAVLIGVITLAV